MNSDIRLSVGFWSHPKTRKLVKRLGIEAIRSLQILWLWAAQNRPDGVLSGMDWEDIELAADWQGEERAFFDCCLGMWIDEADEGYELHDWSEHNPWVSETDERRDKARFSRLAQVNPQAHEELRLAGVNSISRAEYERLTASRRLPGECLATAGRPPAEPRGDAGRLAGDSPAPSPSPALTHKEQTGSLRSPVSPEPRAAHSGKASSPKPETSPVHAAPVSRPSPPEAPSGAVPPPEAVPDVLQAVIALPLNTGEEHPVTAGEVETWQDLYPAVDVMQELRNMRGWLLGNKTRRKTRHGIGRFIQSWLAKEQNRGGRRGVTPEPIGIPGQGNARDRPAARTVAQQQVQNRDAIARMLIAYREGNNARQERNAAGYSGPVGPALSAGGLYPRAVACPG